MVITNSAVLSIKASILCFYFHSPHHRVHLWMISSLVGLIYWTCCFIAPFAQSWQVLVIWLVCSYPWCFNDSSFLRAFGLSGILFGIYCHITIFSHWLRNSSLSARYLYILYRLMGKKTLPKENYWKERWWRIFTTVTVIGVGPNSLHFYYHQFSFKFFFLCYSYIIPRHI